MPLIDTAFAKLHLRVDGSAEDTLVALYVSAAEGMAVHYVDRGIYVDAPALAAAIAAAPAELAAAVDAYDAAILAADAMEEGAEQDAAIKYAQDALAAAQAASDRTQRGMVVTDQVKTAILLITGILYETRGAAQDIPAGAKSLLDTVKAY